MFFNEKCTTCLPPTILYKDGKCKGEAETVSDGTYCNRVPNATLKLIQMNETTLMPIINISCGVDSIVHYIWGLNNTVNWDSVTVDNITQFVLRNLTNVKLPTDLQKTWIGYGFISKIGSEVVILDIPRPLKNTGEMYQVKVFCQSLAGGLNSSAKLIWKQTANHGLLHTIILTLQQTLCREWEVMSKKHLEFLEISIQMKVILCKLCQNCELCNKHTVSPQTQLI